MKPKYICPNCQKPVTAKTSTCPMCHATLPIEWQRKHVDKMRYGALSLGFAVVMPALAVVFTALALRQADGGNAYGIASAVFAALSLLAFVFGALAINRNTGAEVTMGKVAIVITCISTIVYIIFLVVTFELLFGTHYGR